MIAINEQDRMKAFDLFDQGETAGRVSNILFAGHWYKAKKLRDEWEATQRQTVSGSVEPLVLVIPDLDVVVPKDAAAVVEVDAVEDGGEDDEEPQRCDLTLWDLTLQVSTEGLDRVITRFSPEEKAFAVSQVLQARLSAEA